MLGLFLRCVNLDPHYGITYGNRFVLKVKDAFLDLHRRDAHILGQDRMILVGDVTRGAHDVDGFDIHLAAVIQWIGALGMAQGAGNGQHRCQDNVFHGIRWLGN